MRNFQSALVRFEHHPTSESLVVALHEELSGIRLGNAAQAFGDGFRDDLSPRQAPTPTE